MNRKQFLSAIPFLAASKLFESMTPAREIETKEIPVTVSGEITVKGSDLVYIINRKK